MYNCIICIFKSVSKFLSPKSCVSVSMCQPVYPTFSLIYETRRQSKKEELLEEQDSESSAVNSCVFFYSSWQRQHYMTMSNVSRYSFCVTILLNLLHLLHTVLLIDNILCIQRCMERVFLGVNSVLLPCRRLPGVVLPLIGTDGHAGKRKRRRRHITSVISSSITYRF